MVTTLARQPEDTRTHAQVDLGPLFSFFLLYRYFPTKSTGDDAGAAVARARARPARARPRAAPVLVVAILADAQHRLAELRHSETYFCDDGGAASARARAGPEPPATLAAHIQIVAVRADV
ncbi:hypothetical protein EVAR_17929_1 [Eumeta japonica]|uniref:Uncharacterized protein n=1 Tax=Eumeta variegata TaxID=151549 RepID=A0A4C1UYW4_EUMVA|nr:hypothetical protein EVAR_17929_1 [Eumeta japonica]